MSKLIIAALVGVLILSLPVAVLAESEDTITRKSSRSFSETLNLLETAAKQKGLTVFGRLDHAAAASAVGLKMPASTVLVVGNPKLGTERFIRYPVYAIDLPLKVLVWEDANGSVSVTYNTSQHLLGVSKRHGLTTDDAAVTQAKRTEQLMEELAQAATR